VTPDGKYVVRLLAAGVGTLDYRPDSVPYVAFHKFAKSYLPVVLFRRLPAPRNVKHQAPPTANGAPPLLMLFDVRPIDPTTRARSFVLNETRFTFDEQSGYPLVANNSHRIVAGPGEIVSVDMFPRRDQEITVRLAEAATSKTYLTATFPNAAPVVQAKKWTSEPLPITRSSRELNCTLTGFHVTDSRQLGAPKVKVEASSAAWVKHQVQSVLQDATGNSGYLLSPFEPVWKVITSVRRTAESGFNADETWQSPAFGVPGEKQVTELGMQGQIGATTIKLVAAKGLGYGDIQLVDDGAVFTDGRQVAPVPVPRAKPGTMSFYNIQSTATDVGLIRIRLLNLSRGDDVLVRATDQDGNMLGNVVNQLNRFHDDSGLATVQFRPGESTRTITVSVMISRPQVFEFYAEPPAELRAKYAKAVSE